MYVIIAPIQIKSGHKEEFIEALIYDAKGSVNDEPECLQFNVIQDANDSNRIWLYEVYTSEAAFQQHMQTPHYTKWRDTVKDWMDEAPQSAGYGAYNIWPGDDNWR